MRRIILVIFMLISLVTFKNGLTQVSWRNSSPGAKPFGMGQTGVVDIYDVSALHWNPAGLSYVRAHQGFFTFSPDFRIDAGGYAGFFPLIGTFATYMARIPNDDANQITAAGWGKQLTSSTHLGLAVNFVQFEHDNATALSFGFLFKPISSISFASDVPFGVTSILANRFTFGAGMHGISLSKHKLQSQLQLGFSYAYSRYWPKLIYAAHIGSKPPSYHLGFTYNPFSVLELYTGLADWEIAKAGVGLGWHWQNVTMDVIYNFDQQVFKFTTTFDIGPPAKELSARAYANAYAYLQDNHLRKAYNYSRKSLAYDPQNIQASEIIASTTPQLRAERHLIDSLLVVARDCIDKRWYISAATLYLKVLHLDADHNDAAKALERISPYVTEHTEKWFELAQQYYTQGDLEMAKDVIENILRVRPEHEEASQYLTKISNEQEKKAKQYFYVGLGYYQQKKYDEAEAQFAQALIMLPDYTEASHYLNLISSEKVRNAQLVADMFDGAKKLERSREWQAAIEKYHQILKITPDNEPAKENIHQATERMNSYLSTLFTRAESAWQRGNRTLAKKLFKQILEIKPNYPGARKYLEEMLTSFDKSQRFLDLSKRYNSQGRWEAAAIALDSVRKYNPYSSEAKRLRQKIYANLNPVSIMNRCQRAYEQGRFKEALDDVNTILEKNPSHRAAKTMRDQCQIRIDRLVDEYFNRGIQFFTEENYQVAIAEWLKALQLNPSHRGSLEYKKRAEERLQVLSGMK